MKIYCATTNPGKLKEFRAAASSSPSFQIDALPGLSGIPHCEETGSTFEENATQKALYYSSYTPEYLFVDDSGLSIGALRGAPGIHSARFAGLASTDEANNRLLLQKMQGVADRRAHFICVIALARAGRIIRTFRGEAEGTILEELRGNNGFGYDPLFFHPESGRTFGEVSRSRKQEVSHRGKALKMMVHFLETGHEG